MNEKMMKHLDDIISAIKSGADWATTQGGALATEILLYKETISLIGLIFGIIALTGAIFLFLWAVRKHAKEDEGITFLLMCISGGVVLLFFIWTCADLSLYIKCKTAPRLVIVEEISKLTGASK